MHRILIWFLSLCFFNLSSSLFSDDLALRKRASWASPTPGELTKVLPVFLHAMGSTNEEIDAVMLDWNERKAAEDFNPLSDFMAALTQANQKIAKLVEFTRASPSAGGIQLTEFGWLDLEQANLPPLVIGTVRTWLGLQLVRERLYDEALPILTGLDVSLTIDPATLLFNRGVCHHSLLMKKESLLDLRKLVENEKDTPVRYFRTAQLMIADISPLEKDSLDEISRLMTDVSRRLDLGRANEDVAERQQAIIDKLTRLIEKLEEQQSEQSQEQQSQSQNQSKPQGEGQPLDQSQLEDTKGRGDAGKKALGQTPGWGQLPPAQREEALQRISRDLPTHHREVIEAYFRKLAQGSGLNAQD